MEAIDDDYSVEGPGLRVMWDFGAGPLWSDGDGLLPDDPDWLKRALGLSDTLITDLLDWMRDKDTADRFNQQQAHLDERGQHLADSLQIEVGTRFVARYHR